MKQQIKKATLLDNLIFYSFRPFYATIYLSLLVKKPMELLRQHIKPSEVYRRSDLEYFSSAIDQHSFTTQPGSIIINGKGSFS